MLELPVSTSFRFVQDRDERNVTLRLFQRSGRALGEVTGPRRCANGGFVDVADKVWATDPHRAFSSAIRMANLEEVELVVTGDPLLWIESWGDLRTRFAAPVPAALLKGETDLAHLLALPLLLVF